MVCSIHPLEVIKRRLCKLMISTICKDSAIYHNFFTLTNNSTRWCREKKKFGYCM